MGCCCLKAVPKSILAGRRSSATASRAAGLGRSRGGGSGMWRCVEAEARVFSVHSAVDLHVFFTNAFTTIAQQHLLQWVCFFLHFRLCVCVCVCVNGHTMRVCRCLQPCYVCLCIWEVCVSIQPSCCWGSLGSPTATACCHVVFVDILFYSTLPVHFKCCFSFYCSALPGSVHRTVLFSCFLYVFTSR